MRPSVWQARIIISWGVMLLCHIPVRNKGGIYATRFLLGLFEAGMFPGVILQMTYWYRPDEMSIRLLYFCTSYIFQKLPLVAPNTERLSRELFRCHQRPAGLRV